MKKVELLAPGGSLDKLKYAIRYGADAVYLGIPDFSLRVRINRFDEKSLSEGVKYAKEHGKKVYVTLNIYAHNKHLPEIEKHLGWLGGLGIDAIIVSDPGIIMLIKKHLPEVDIHLSTQANATNWQAVAFWKSIGVSRVILAREVSLSEIREIRDKVPGIELEYFVHGAMCMSYSGRCILSKWMTGRSGNLGDCSQPCRWGYHNKNQKSNLKNKNIGNNFFDMSVVDDQKRYEMDVEEDAHGTYFFNSYDMNMIEHISELISAGVTSLKIEGRAKSAYYLAVVCRAYRKVIDASFGAIHELPLQKAIIAEQKKELDKLTHRGYSTGFLLGDEPKHNFSGELKGGEWKFVGEVVAPVGDFGVAVGVHNEIYAGDKLEAVAPEKNIPVKIKKILDHNGKEVSEAHGGHDKRYYFEFDKKLPEGSLLRKKV